MSDINIPGVSSRFNTNKIVEDLMKVEKAPLTKMEARAEKLESDKIIWQNLKTRITELASQCASLYNYDNPLFLLHILQLKAQAWNNDLQNDLQQYALLRSFF